MSPEKVRRHDGAWFGDRHLVVAGVGPRRGKGDVAVQVGDGRVAGRVQWMRDVGIQLGVIEVPTGTATGDLKEHAESDLGRIDLVSPGDLLRAGVSSLGPEARAKVLEFLLDTCSADADVLGVPLARALRDARDVLRERQPPAVVDRAGPPALHIEVVAKLDPRCVYVRGWVGYHTADLAHVVVVSPEGSRADVTGRLHRFAKPDVATFYGSDTDAGVDFGVAVLVELDHPFHGDDGWLIEIETVRGVAMEGTCPRVTAGPAEVRGLLAADLPLERPGSTTLRTDHLAPAMLKLQAHRQRDLHLTSVEQFGAEPAAPDVSLVIPLYKRIDFVEHQMAQFVHDPYVARQDIIYVLDSPEQADDLIGRARRLQRLYGVPFRVAVMSENGGYSAANNLGASLARGRHLLLMNSDVLPCGPGWLERLVVNLWNRDGVGAVGPKLVYEDDSIQHAGMFFERMPGGALWSNEHYFKGLHRTFPAATRSRRVPAVTAACMLLDTDEYRSLGGMQGGYVQGDFEDSDLCLRLAAKGLDCWYAADVELYHLEGQSYPTPLRVLNGEFNKWLHTQQWDAAIARVMAEVGS